MRAKDIQVGEQYSTQHNRRVLVLDDLGSGRWQVRFLDPPTAGHETSMSSRDLAEPWRWPEARLEEEASLISSDDSIPGARGLARARLLRLGARLSQRLQRIDDSHPVEVPQIREDSLIHFQEQRAELPGVVHLALPEPVARRLLEHLGEELEAQGNGEGLTRMLHADKVNE